MLEQKSIIDFNMKDWRNLGVYLVLFGLIIIFLGKDLSTGFGFFAVGIIFTAIFQGPKLLKILKKKNW